MNGFLQQKSSKVIEYFNKKNNYEWEFEGFNPKNNKIVKISLFICHCPVQNYFNFKCKDCNKMFELKKPKREACLTCHDKKIKQLNKKNK